MDSTELEEEPREGRLSLQLRILTTTFSHLPFQCRGASRTLWEGTGPSKLGTSLEYQTRLSPVPGIFSKTFFYPEWPFGCNDLAATSATKNFLFDRRADGSFVLILLYICSVKAYWIPDVCPTLF